MQLHSNYLFNMTHECPKKAARIMTKSDFTTKHHMFRTKTHANPENCTHPPDVMDVTFRRSEAKFTPSAKLSELLSQKCNFDAL